MKKKHIAALVFAGLGLLFGGGLVQKKMYKAQHEAIWGTVKNPAYKVTCDIQPAITYGKYLSDEEEYFNEKTKFVSKIPIDAIKKKLAEFQEYFKNNPLTPEQQNQIKKSYETFRLCDKPAGLEERIKKLKDFIELHNACTELDSHIIQLTFEISSANAQGYLDRVKKEIDIDSMQFDKSSKLSGQYGPVDDFARDLFEMMTGKKFPADIKLDISEIEKKDVGGRADYKNKKITSEDGHYAHVLGIMMHELGHFSAQHDENACASLNPLRRSSREVDMLEEACAYCFQIASAYALSKKDSFLANASQLDTFECMKDFIEEYFNGEQEYHREASAVADAAITVFGDPAKAYNYLSTADPFNLDQRIRETIEKNRSAYQRVKEQDVQKAYENKLSELEQLDKEFLKTRKAEQISDDY